MRQIQAETSGTRASALWGAGKRRGQRGARVFAGLAVVVLALAVGAATTAAAPAAAPDKLNALVPGDLLADATANPDKTFSVIVQGDKESTSDDVANDVGNGKSMRQFMSITGVATDVTGKELLKLARHPHIEAITPDTPLELTSYQQAEGWREAGEADVKSLWGSGWTPAPSAPAIAFVDSGIDSSNAWVFDNRVIANVNLCSLCTSSTSATTYEGHGTMVAGAAAGKAAGGFNGGVAQQAPLVMLRTADGTGQSKTSDVLAAVDWIMSHRVSYNIRVANFSMVGNTRTTFMGDPLDRAVEKLWLNGVVVVTAAGNYGSGGGTDVSYAPANDPFVITVGATDIHSNTSYSDDTVPSWSAFGHTADGFEKPEISAPGRYLMLPTVMGTYLTQKFQDRLYCSIYRCALPAIGAPVTMWMSGTSFSAGIVSGLAAQILARHPSWTPDQVKGALMVSARALPSAAALQGGVGMVDGAAAAAVSSPPNPNQNLNTFVVTDSKTGLRSFDYNSWASAVKANPTWTTASWTSGSWTGASWTSGSWTGASWTSASWTSASWTSASWTSASWTSASWPE